MTNIEHISEGTQILLDEGFNCVEVGAQRAVCRDDNGLYFLCHSGRHYLDGQLSDNGKHYVGIALAPVLTP